MDCFQLANIVWGEAGESDDHIVPYPEAEDPSIISSLELLPSFP